MRRAALPLVIAARAQTSEPCPSNLSFGALWSRRLNVTDDERQAAAGAHSGLRGPPRTAFVISMDDARFAHAAAVLAGAGFGVERVWPIPLTDPAVLAIEARYQQKRDAGGGSPRAASEDSRSVMPPHAFGDAIDVPFMSWRPRHFLDTS